MTGQYSTLPDKRLGSRAFGVRLRIDSASIGAMLYPQYLPLQLSPPKSYLDISEI